MLNELCMEKFFKRFFLHDMGTVSDVITGKQSVLSLIIIDLYQCFSDWVDEFKLH